MIKMVAVEKKNAIHLCVFKMYSGLVIYYLDLFDSENIFFPTLQLQTQASLSWSDHTSAV